MTLSFSQCEPIGGRPRGSASTKSWHWGKGKKAPYPRFSENVEQFWHKFCSSKNFFQFKWLSEFFTKNLPHPTWPCCHTSNLTLGATLDSFLPSSFHSKPFFTENISTVENRVWNPDKLKTKTNLYQVEAFGRVWEDIQLVPKMVTKAQAGTLELPPEGENQSRAQK